MRLSHALAGALMLVAAFPASAQTWPEKTITFVVGASPGGSTDITARLVAEPLGKALGQSVVVENKPGGSGNIAALQVARAKPDGYTILVQYSGYHVGNPALFDKMAWDPVKDFAPVAMATLAPHLFTVHPNVQANTLKELADLARSKPGQLTYGSAGNGSIQHIATAMFAQQTRTELTHIPYKGTTPALQDQLGGRVDILNSSPPPLVPYVKNGKLKALAFTSDRRHPQMPDVPTSAESGLPGYEVASWFAFFAPAKTPPEVVNRLAEEIRKIVESEDYRKKMEDQGAFAVFKGPKELDEFARKEIEYWGNIIRAAGIKGGD